MFTTSRRGVLALCLATCLPFMVSAQQSDTSYFFGNGTFNPSVTLSTKCSNAILAPVPNCLDDVLTYAYADSFFPLGNVTYQQQLCAPACGTSLAKYVANVTSACTGQPAPFNGLPATYYGNWAWAAYNLTCLTDAKTGEYCIDYFFNLFPNSTTTETTFSQIPTSQLCTDCVYKLFRQQQGTPYSNYDTDAASEWATIQSLCSVSYPTTVPAPVSTDTSILAGYAANVTFTATCLSGNTYTVVGGDNVQAIAQKNNVATGTVLAINQLLPDGSDLQGGQTLCLPYTCQTHTVVNNDTCAALSTAAGISVQSFLGYNPTVNQYCTNLIVGQTVCLTPPGGAWNATTIAGSIPTQTAIYATTTVAAPGPTAHGTSTQCAKYYQVQPGDFCQVVAVNQTISLPLFEAINPSIDLGCDNLVPGLWYCVSPLQYWNQTGTPTQPAEVDAPTTTPDGTTSECYQWYVVQPNDDCAIIESSFGVTFSQLQIWNPALNSTCGNLVLGEAYCVSSPETSAAPVISGPVTVVPTSTGGSAPTSSTIVPAPSPTVSGTTSNCYQWYVVQSGDSCGKIDTAYGITFAQFQTWNTGVNSGCTNIQVGVAYCVNSPITATPISSAHPTSSTVPAPSPTVSGTTSNCYKWYVVQSGDNCGKIDTTYSITFAQFQTWNTGVNSGCTNIQVGVAYCVSSPLTAQTTTTSASTPASSTVPAPSPTVSGTTSNCYKWYVVQSGDNCGKIDTAYGITFAQFEAWNTGVNSACTNIQVGVAYCVSSPIKPASKLKREDENTMKGVGGWPIMKPVRNAGLPPKHPGIHAAYDKIAHS